MNINKKITSSLQEFYNSIGEKAKPLIIKNETIRALFDRYGIKYEVEEESKEG